MTDHHTAAKPAGDDPAVQAIRSKINGLYADEPNAQAEAAKAQTPGVHSKHQLYMQKLSTSGKSLAEIQTAWHEYYVGLPDDEKHAVWQEFYATHAQQKQSKPEPSTSPIPASTTHKTSPKSTTKKTTPRSVADLKQHLVGKIGARGKLSKKHHLQSIMFGLGMGSIAVLILLFSFFNERFIAPFITPSRAVSSTPIIIDPNSTAVGPEAKVVIPKINVEVPVVYGQASIAEKDIQNSLEQGVVHYAITSNPGEQGNTVIVGHSSNNLLNKGKYKFAFVLLNKLEIGDTFSLNKDGKRYTYKIYQKKIVKPTDVSVLGATDKPATATLITCDPPGTALNRLVVVGEQISPDPTVNVASTAVKTEQAPSLVPGNAPSLWQRIRNWFTG